MATASLAPAAAAVRKTRRTALLGRGLIATLAVGVVGGLLATTVTAYLSIERASATVALGEGDAILRSLIRLGGPNGPPPTPDDLAECLDSHREDGLRYLALVGPDQRVHLDLGTASVNRDTFEREIARLRPGIPERNGAVLRLVSRPLPPRRGPLGAPPPDGVGGGFRPGRDPRPPLGPPVFVIEYQPIVAERLAAQARFTLASGLVAAAALLAGTVTLGRRWLREDALEHRLEQDRRLATLGEMSAVLAHEIRNPLASLKGHAQLLVEMLAEPGATRAKAKRVVSEAVRLEALTSDLLEFVRAGKIERRPTSLAALLRDMAESEGGTRLRVDLTRAPATWPLDPARMRQVLTNLIRNAVQASPGDEPVEVEATIRDGQLVISVRDHGAGLPAGDPAALFEPFHTTRTHGTGLGLTVARRLVGLHHGTIRAFNHESGGAVFRVVLPRD